MFIKLKTLKYTSMFMYFLSCFSQIRKDHTFSTIPSSLSNILNCVCQTTILQRVPSPVWLNGILKWIIQIAIV